MTNNQNDLADRIILANEKLVFADGTYVLAILNRALRGEDNPVIDAACLHAKELNIGLVVYSELDETVAYASDRLFYFALGAFRELAQTLAAENIQCVQGIDKTGKGEQVRSLINQAAVVYMYEEHTHWDKAKIDKVLKTAFQTVYLVDASRLVPTRKLPLDLKTTPEFRKAHEKLRDKYTELRKVETEITANTTIITEQNFAEYNNEALRKLVAQCNINHDLKISEEHPPTLAEINARITTLKIDILAKYKWIRNNPALE